MPNLANENGMSTHLDQLIDDKRGNFFEKFIHKWIIHNHNVPIDHCSVTMTFDGDWKVSRLKCAYDGIYYDCPDYGRIQVGCTKTPQRGSYFCAKHEKHELVFNVGDTFISVHPRDIKISKKCN